MWVQAWRGLGLAPQLVLAQLVPVLVYGRLPALVPALEPVPALELMLALALALELHAWQRLWQHRSACRQTPACAPNRSSPRRQTWKCHEFRRTPVVGALSWTCNGWSTCSDKLHCWACESGA